MPEFLKDLLQTAFRMVPWPTEPGLRRVGSPGRRSPVLLTANYDLTVRRLVRALRGVDAWLLVAPAGGINVWCAAAGGHLTTHQVVTALKTSGVAEQVDHRELVLPQLAATGVEGLAVFRRSRWRVRFGPVRAQDLPAYLAANGEKTDSMRRVVFSLHDRLEMAAAWAAPISIVLAAGALLLRPAWTLPLVGLCFGLAAAVFLVYDRIPRHRKLVVGGAATLASLAAVFLAGGGSAAHAGALLAPAALLGILTMDYAGSTPTEGSGHFDGQDWKITLDLERCDGVFRCWEVCPEACFEKREAARVVDLAHDERCVRCGACVVQCPQDALFFQDGAGRRIEPETLRRFKLNLLGKRTVGVPAVDDDAA
ncbi:4Fe-4S binding protein [Myxococcota bacterium]|nr:4Fe-4S binding protein [Myxococcota bacterium]MCZ7618350.1 4Fe-4S binding protein [Myxococcota bacterium]